MRVLKIVFGSHGQAWFFTFATLVALALWGWYCFHPVTIGAVFHISMFFGVVACYAGVSSALGFKATERVETAVVQNIEQANTVVEGA